MTSGSGQSPVHLVGALGFGEGVFVAGPAVEAASRTERRHRGDPVALVTRGRRLPGNRLRVADFGAGGERGGVQHRDGVRIVVRP
ncbi:hypothetical protein [Streptomyces sp. MA15]|uniref:hypothetical protein n=1 Tax=Streptomyces sp. MA15 TaxID=3055061 RepID=UPI0025B155D7|nr:hypothetical protein [Streptomyces sp. MA15]MDN3267765.1 hypothetical protein [Streptomyces sp. MA15]